MAISLDNLKKVELAGSRTEVEKGTRLTAIIKVKSPNHVPTGVNARARIDSLKFTGTFMSENLTTLESDENVESIALSTPLKMIK